MRPRGEPDPRYIQARRALLDVLEALGVHRRAVVLVGAQAIYLNVGEADEPLSSFTKDADLALNPELLAREPAIEDVLENAGFRRRNQPGLWFDANGLEVDLLVPASIAGRGRRGVDLGEGHQRTVAMRAAGLEAALVDNSIHDLTALDQADTRSFSIAVAGCAALLVAKLHKLGERDDDTRDRLNNKDASDVYLLLQRTQTEELAETLGALSKNAGIRPSIEVALGYLQRLFVLPSGVGISLLRDAVRGIDDEETVAQACMFLAQDLLSQMSR